jgi:hypothetical protein
MSRQLAIQRGKKQDTQSFSSACPINPDTEALLEETLKPSIDVARRFQILHDIKKVTQFSLVWGDRIGYLTRPTLYTGDDNVTVVVGSFSDVIGQALPVAIPLDAFHGYFTTLHQGANSSARSCDRLFFLLAVHFWCTHPLLRP